MRPSEALERHRTAIRALTERHRTTNPRVFGSVLDGEDESGSDLDILVDRLPGTTLIDLAGLQIELEELLGVPVDVRTPTELSSAFRDDVVARSRPI